MHIIGNLTSLVALHILFSAPEYCAALLRELRLCAIDIIYQNRLPGFRYVGISHMANGPVATKITELQWPIYKSLNQREKSMEALAKMLFEAKSRVQQEAQAGSSYGQSFDSDPEDAGELPVKYTRTLEVHEVKDIKIWKREIYNSHL